MKSDSKARGMLGVKGAGFSAEIEAELFNRAEKELAAFVAAVITLHGEEQARAAADDWLLELTALKGPSTGASPDLDLRSVTIVAARRRARRLSIPTPLWAEPKQIENRTTSGSMESEMIQHRRVTQWKQSDY